MKHVIYKITSPSGKVYIGRTKDFKTRMVDHKHNALTNKRDNSLYRAINKYGWDHMDREILLEVNEEESHIQERILINKYDSVRKGYNDTYNTVGSGNVWEGREDTKEYKEFTDKMSKITSGENNGMFGRTHSEETRAKMTAKAAGRCSLEWFINKHGQVEGTERYESMMEKRRKNRYAKMKTDEQGKFI